MKDKNTAGIFAFFLGGIGAHKFYLGQAGWGVAYIVFCWTFIPAGVALIEGIVLLSMSEEAFDAKYNAVGFRREPNNQNIVVNVAATGSRVEPGPDDFTARLKRLHDLHVAGALTEEEYTAEKRKLLA